MRVVFRADASLQIGTGHVMRCLTLAEALRMRGAECRFLCREHPGNLIEFIRAKGFAVDTLPLCEAAQADTGQQIAHSAWLGATQERDTAACTPILAAVQPEWLIVDHYALDARWELALKPHYRRLMVIDDLADRAHVCDLLLDQNFARTAVEYARLVPTHCRVLAGSSYVLLRPQFAARRRASLMRQSAHVVKHFLIQMGGMEQCAFTCEVLSVLQECDLPSDARITVVLSTETPATNAVRQQAAVMKWPTTVRIGVQDMAGLMDESDLAIGTGGGATYERIFMGLPSILRPAAANQIDHLRRMAGAGLFELYESAEDLARKIERVLREGVCSPPAVVDDGAVKLADELLKLRVTLRPPRPLDVRRTFRWLQDYGLRVLFLMRQKPELKPHFRYWKTLLRDPQQRVFSIYYGDVHVGNAGLKNLSAECGEAELWLYLGDSDTRGKGIGQQALGELERIIRYDLGVQRAVLHVSKNNHAANRLYQRSGYIPVISDSHLLAVFQNSDVMKMEKRL